jgi:RNA polymerase sigma factor (sigma-70 family)
MESIINKDAMDDFNLIEQILKGSSFAQKKLFDKFAPKLMFVCLRYCKEREDAEDVLQEGFIKIFSNLYKYKHDGSFDGWMRRIMVNCCLDFLRKEKLNMNNFSFEEVDYFITNNESASDFLNVEDIMKMINSLPNGYRVVFNLFAIEGYSHKEIAELLTISEETSKSQYFRAKNLLKKQLEKIEHER